MAYSESLRACTCISKMICERKSRSKTAKFVKLSVKAAVAVALLRHLASACAKAAWQGIKITDVMPGFRVKALWVA